MEVSNKADFVGQPLASSFPWVVTPGCEQLGGDMRALATKYLADVGKLPESDLSLHVRNVVEGIPDMLILDVSVTHIIYCNPQDSTDTMMEEYVKGGEKGVAQCPQLAAPE